MNNLFRLLQQIKDDPIAYLGKPSITCLDSFLTGYLSTRTMMGLDQEGSGIEGFQEWIQEREKTNVSQSWAGIILFVSGNERSALYIFFDLFEMFLKRSESLESENESEKDSSSTMNDLRYRNYDYYDDLLKGIKKRPGMFLGTASITRLDMLLRGCSLARREVGIPPTKPEREFEGFPAWIQEKYGIKSGQSWAKIILFYSVDEREALWKFFELFEEYLNRNKSSEVDENSG